VRDRMACVALSLTLVIYAAGDMFKAWRAHQTALAEIDGAERIMQAQQSAHEQWESRKREILKAVAAPVQTSTTCGSITLGTSRAERGGK
jgi:hypothetical protein